MAFLEAKRPLLLISLDVELYLAFHAEGKDQTEYGSAEMLFCHLGNSTLGVFRQR